MSYHAPNLTKDKHIFFGVAGGVSEGKYKSLNVNYKSLDNKDNIDKNIKIIANSFNLSEENVFMPIQTHSNKAVFVKHPSRRTIEADGCVCDNQDILLIVRSADCIPVLLRDDVKGLVGAAHSGWVGSLNGVVCNTIKLMVEHGSNPKDICVGLGPCLQKPSFRVKNDLYEKFLAETAENKKYFEPIENGYLFNHQKYLVDKIKKNGVENICTSDIDTYTNLDYFSFRRNTHKGLIKFEKDYPTQASVVKL